MFTASSLLVFALGYYVRDTLVAQIQSAGWEAVASISKDYLW